MAATITFDAASNGLATSATTLTVSHTCTANANRVLWVHVINSLSSDKVTGITYNGVAMTFVKNLQVPGDRWMCLYKLIAPASGANNIVVTLSSADRIEMYAASYYNVQQTTASNGVTTNTINGTSITGTLQTFTNGTWLLGALDPSGAGGAASTGSVQRSVTAAGAGIYDSNVAYNTGSHSMSMTMNSAQTALITVTMEPATTVLTDGLMSYWKLDGNSNDSVNSNNGTDTAVTYNSSNAKLIQGAGFNGSTSKILISDNANLKPLTLSVNWWANFTNVTNFNPTVSKGQGDTSGFLTLSRSSAHYSISLANAGGATELQFSATLATNVWYMFSMTYDGTTMAIYLNGSQVTTGTLSGGYVPSSNNLEFGESVSLGQFFSGKIDEIGLWSRALAASEITQLYNNGVGNQYPNFGLSGSQLLNIAI